MRNLVVLLLGAAFCAMPAERFDVVVYGATAGGAIAAIAAAKEGARVALLEPGRHAGGMLTGGLGRTDMDRQESVIGGLFARVLRTRRQALWRTCLLAIRAQRRRAHSQRLAERSRRSRAVRSPACRSPTSEAGRIVSLRTTSGDVFEAPVFIDSTYEGDLMKAAGVSYAVGRDSRSLYNESLAGRQDFLPGSHQFRAAVPALGADGKLLPYVLAQETLEPTGTGGRKFQSYCFRICLTRNPANRLPLPRPEGYDPARFELARAYLKALGDSAKLADFMGISLLPNDKTDINSGGAVSTNLPGASWEYPEASYERRREIWQEHLSWAQGLLYFLGNDPDVPAALRAEMNQWGLAKDEFPDTGHWPHQLYIREGRRMLGEYRAHAARPPGEPAQGRFDWNGRLQHRYPRSAVGGARRVSLSRRAQRGIHGRLPQHAGGAVRHSLSCAAPETGQCENLLVTACISASSIAYASFRMEPQYMIAGHAAGVAAAMAVEERCAVDVRRIRRLRQTSAGEACSRKSR